MSDKTQTVEESKQVLADIIVGMINDLGYSEAETWERIANTLLHGLEMHNFDPPTIEQEMELASFMSGIKVTHLTETEA